MKDESEKKRATSHDDAGNAARGKARDPDLPPLTSAAPISLEAVARACGVSTSTVSRVLSGAATVARATRQRVRTAIDRLGYVPNAVAQGLSRGRTRVIGLALPRFHGEFMSYLLAGADEEATALGYHLMMTTIVTGVDGRRRNRIVGSGLVDAMLLVITDPADPLVSDAHRAGLPTVVMDTDLTAQGFDSVILDNEKGTREAVEHLLRWSDPASLYFVGGPKGNFDTTRRAAAFSLALSSAGFEPSPDQISFGDYSLQWGREWAMRMLHHGRLAGAVLTANDNIACGILHAAGEAGVKVPEQLRVVGFNDSLIARIVEPQLSTVALPMSEVGATAVRLLERRIENPTAEILCRKLPTNLVVRESSTVRRF